MSSTAIKGIMTKILLKSNNCGIINIDEKEIKRTLKVTNRKRLFLRTFLSLCKSITDMDSNINITEEIIYNHNAIISMRLLPSETINVDKKNINANNPRKVNSNDLRITVKPLFLK